MADIGSGQDMLHLPFGELISSVANGIADAQFKMDQSSMNVAEMMSGTRVLRTMESGEPILNTENKPTILDSRVYFGHTRQPQGFGAVAKARISRPAGGLKAVKVVYPGDPGKRIDKDKKVEVEIIGGGGTGAKAKVKVDRRNGEVISVTVIDKGSGYTSPPEVKITGLGRLKDEDKPIFETVLTELRGPVGSIEVVESGEGYTLKPIVNVVGVGSGAKYEAVVNNGKLEGLKKIEAGEGYDPEETYVEIIPQAKLEPQKLSMIELGFVPNFYQFVDTVINMKVALRVTRNQEGNYQVHAATVDANYASSYNYNLEIAASVQTKIVPIPPPTILEERIRAIANSEVIDQDVKFGGIKSEEDSV